MYRVCWLKNNKVQCSEQCYGIYATEPIFMEKRLDGAKTTLEPCSSLLPEFLDIIKAEYNATKRFQKFNLQN